MDLQRLFRRFLGRNKEQHFEDDEQYQDLIIGDEILTGVRECSQRFEAMKPLLDRYQRTFTTLDIGANMGYFSFRIAKEYPAVAVMIESRSNDGLLARACDLNRANVVWLRCRITAEELEKLAKVEHFDVLLVMNFLHHLGDKWRLAWEAALRMADHVLVETPTDVGACGQQYLSEINTEVERNASHILGTFARHTGKGHSMLYHIVSESQKKLIRPYWVLPKDKAFRDSRVMGQHDLRINSNFSEKALIHGDRGQQPPWVPGINSMTYRALGGAYPRAETIRTWASKLPSGPDMNLWNLILSGDGLSVIDQHGNHESLLWDYLP